MSEEKHTDMYLASEIEQYIQVKDVRYTLDEFNRIGELLLGRNLTDDQQVVLDWLKLVSKDNGEDAMDCIYWFVNGEAETSVSLAFIELDNKQQFQVLAAFAEWGCKSSE